METVIKHNITITDEIVRLSGKTTEQQVYSTTCWSIYAADQEFAALVGEDLIDNGFVLAEGSKMDPHALGEYRKVKAIKKSSNGQAELTRTYRLVNQETILTD